MSQRSFAVSDPDPSPGARALGAPAPAAQTAQAAPAEPLPTSSSWPPAAPSPAPPRATCRPATRAARSASSSSSPPSRRPRSSPTCAASRSANIGSQDMNDEVWLKLAKRVNELVGEARRGRRRHHPRHRHDRGDRVLPEPGRQVAEAGRADRGDAPVHRAVGGRPAQLLQCRGGGGQQGRGGTGRTGGGQRLDPRRVLAHQDQHHRRADFPVAGIGL